MREDSRTSHAPLIAGIVFFLLASAAVAYLTWLNPTLFAPGTKAQAAVEVREKTK